MYGSVDISRFCNEVISVGDPLEFYEDDSPQCPPLVRKYMGGAYAGVSLNSVIHIDYTTYRPNFEEVSVGSKISIATSGCEVHMPIAGNAGEYIRPRKDGTWKIGCKRKNATGQVIRSDGNFSIVRLM